MALHYFLGGGHYPLAIFEGSISAMVFYKPSITSAQAEALSWALDIIRLA